jgi:hypothetical protein
MLHAALRAFPMCVFSVHFNLHSNCTPKTHGRLAASSVLGHIFVRISKLHVIAADCLLQIQTAHPKRKISRPLI